MADFASLSPMTQGPLAEMLLALQRQGAAQKAQTGPILGQGIEGMLQGFQRQGELGRQRQFAVDMSARENLQRQGLAEQEAGYRKELETGRQTFEAGQADLQRRAAELQGIEELQGKIATELAGAMPGSDTTRLQGLWDNLEARKLGLGGKPMPSPFSSNTPSDISKSLSEGAAGRIGPQQGWDFSRGPLGMMKPGSVPVQKTATAKPGDASKRFQSKQWAGFVAGDPAVRAAVRGMSGVEPRRPEARLYAKAAELLAENAKRGFPLTLDEIKKDIKDDIASGDPSLFAGINSEQFEPTPYFWGAAERILDPRVTTERTPVGEIGRIMDPAALSAELEGELTAHPAALRQGGTEKFARTPVFVKRKGGAALKRHPAFADDVVNAVIDQIAAELKYGTR